MNFRWDSDKAGKNLKKHRMDFADAVAVFEDEMVLTIEDPDADGESRFITVGRDDVGCVLVVVYTWRGQDIRLISARGEGRQKEKGRLMKKKAEMREEYDLKNARRGPVAPPEPGKTRITIRIDTDVLNWFRAQVHEAGGGNYQTLINQALRDHLQKNDKDLEEVIRKVMREELQRKAG